jgi:hypothetical protein
VTGTSVSGGTAALPLSDLERALVLAKDSNAAGILQILELGWSTAAKCYVIDRQRTHETPCPPSGDGVLVLVEDNVFRVQARLINVETGDIELSIDISHSTANFKGLKMTLLMPQLRSDVVTVSTAQPESRRQKVVHEVATALYDHIVRAPIAQQAPVLPEPSQATD